MYMLYCVGDFATTSLSILVSCWIEISSFMVSHRDMSVGVSKSYSVLVLVYTYWVLIEVGQLSCERVHCESKILEEVPEGANLDVDE